MDPIPIMVKCNSSTNTIHISCNIAISLLDEKPPILLFIIGLGSDYVENATSQAKTAVTMSTIRPVASQSQKKAITTFLIGIQTVV